MEQNPPLLQCLNCNRPETIVPLVNLRYAGNPAWICTQCLPTLIHQPQRLAGKLGNVEHLSPVPPHKE